MAGANPPASQPAQAGLQGALLGPRLDPHTPGRRGPDTSWRLRTSSSPLLPLLPFPEPFPAPSPLPPPQPQLPRSTPKSARGLERGRLVNHRHVGRRRAEAGCAWAALALGALVENFRRSTGAARRRPCPPPPRSFVSPPPFPPPSSFSFSFFPPFSGHSRAPTLRRFLSLPGAALRPPRPLQRPRLAPPEPFALGAASPRFLRGAPSRHAALPPTLLVADWYPERPGAAPGASALASGAPPPSPATSALSETPHTSRRNVRQREKTVTMGFLSSHLELLHRRLNKAHARPIVFYPLPLNH